MIRIDWKMINKSNHYFVALSGGVDSIAALSILKQLGCNVTGLHVNHKMIPEDDEIEIKVREFCSNTNTDLKVLTPKERLKPSELNARKIRISLFNEFAKNSSCDQSIIYAHHLDDATESYINNCMNGTPEYLPIPFLTKFEYFFAVRPFLLTKKTDFISYATKYDLMKYVYEDPMNKKSRRGFIRTELMPVLEKQWPGIRKVVHKKLLELK